VHCKRTIEQEKKRFKVKRRQRTFFLLSVNAKKGRCEVKEIAYIIFKGLTSSAYGEGGEGDGHHQFKTSKINNKQSNRNRCCLCVHNDKYGQSLTQKKKKKCELEFFLINCVNDNDKQSLTEIASEIFL
jgi:hypothetical protein